MPQIHALSDLSKRRQNYSLQRDMSRKEGWYEQNYIIDWQIVWLWTKSSEWKSNRSLAKTFGWMLGSDTAENVMVYVGVCALVFLNALIPKSTRSPEQISGFIFLCGSSGAELGTVRRTFCCFISSHTCKALHRKLPTGIYSPDPWLTLVLQPTEHDREPLPPTDHD